MLPCGVLPFIALCRPIALYFFGDFSSLFCHFIWPFVCFAVIVATTAAAAATVGDLLLLWLPIDHVVVVVAVVGQLLGAFAGRFVATFSTVFALGKYTLNN